MKLGVVGYGFVGRVLTRFLARSHEVFIYDKFIPEHASDLDRKKVSSSDLVFVAVPTPLNADGQCDTSAIEETVEWIHRPICIKSTIVPGTVDRLVAATGRRIVFCPEYIGEAPDHPWADVDSCGFLIVGGEHEFADLVIKVYKTCSPRLRCYETDARTAELCKYMENCFLGTKFAFVNQFFDIATAFSVSFDELR